MAPKQAAELDADTQVCFEVLNPKTPNTAEYGRYEVYKKATSVQEFFALGGLVGDLSFDYSRGHLKVVPPEKRRRVSGKQAKVEVISDSTAGAPSSGASSSSSNGGANAAPAAKAKVKAEKGLPSSGVASEQPTPKAKGTASRKPKASPKASAKASKEPAAEASAGAELPAASSAAAPEQPVPEPAPTGTNGGRRRLTNEELGLRRFMEVESRKGCLLWKAMEEAVKKGAAMCPRQVAVDAWSSLGAQQREAFVTAGVAKYDKEAEKRKQKPGLTPYSAQLLKEKSKMRIKDLPTMRTELQSRNFEVNPREWSACPEEPEDPPPSFGEGGWSVDIPEGWDDPVELARIFVPLSDVSSMGKASGQLLSDQHNRMMAVKFEMVTQLSCMQTQIGSLEDHVNPCVTKAPAMKNLFADEDERWKMPSDRAGVCRHVFNNSEMYPPQVASIARSITGGTFPDKRQRMTIKLAMYKQQLQEVSRLCLETGCASTAAGAAAARMRPLEKLGRTLQGTLYQSPLLQALLALDLSLPQLSKEENKEAKFKTFRKAVERMQKLLRDLTVLEEQKQKLWAHLVMLRDWITAVDPGCWHMLQLLKPDPEPPAAICKGRRGAVGSQITLGVETRRDVNASIIKALAGVEAAALFEAAASQLPEGWLPVPEDAMRAACALSEGLKDVHECSKVWEGIHHAESGYAVSEAYKQWIQGGCNPMIQCKPFTASESGNKYWFCERCEAWELETGRPSHSQCGVTGGQPARFGPDFTGDSCGFVLDYEEDLHGIVCLKLQACFQQILRRLCWATYWPADQIEASYRLVRKTPLPSILAIKAPQASAGSGASFLPWGSQGSAGSSSSCGGWPRMPTGASSSSSSGAGAFQAVYQDSYGAPAGGGGGGGAGGGGGGGEGGGGKKGKKGQKRSIVDVADGAAEEGEEKESRFSLASCADVVRAPQPVGFQLPLFPSQLRTLAWMRSREELPLEYLSREVIRRNFLSTDIDVELRVDRHWKQVKGGILADSVGYGKTACLIALIQQGLVRPMKEVLTPEEHTRLQQQFILSNATLVITPPNLYEQWLGEFKKFLKPADFKARRIVEIPHINRLNKLSVQDLANAEVVLIPYRFFFSPTYDAWMSQSIGTDSEALLGENQLPLSGSHLQTMRYGILRDFVAKLLQQGPSSAAAEEGEGAMTTETACGQHLPVKVTQWMAPTLEAFYWRRVVFDEFHEVLSIREGRPYHALRQCFAKFHWGLTATPRLGSSMEVADMASLLHLSIPVQDRSEAQHFLDEWVRSSTWDMSTVPLENHIVTVRHTKQERLLYLHQRSIVLSRPGRQAAMEEHLLQLCSHHSPHADLPEEGSGVDTAVVRRRAELHHELEQLQENLRQLEEELEVKQRRWAAIDSLYKAFVAAGLPSGHDARNADLSVRDAYRLAAERNTDAIEVLASGLWAELPPPTRSEDGEQLLGELGQSRPHLSDGAKALLQGLVGEAKKVRHKDHRPKIEPVGPALETYCAALESGIAKDKKSIKQVEMSVRFFENTFRVLEQENAEDMECPVCMEADQQARAITSCGHIFHEECIRMVVREQSACPTCRMALQQRDVNLVTQVLQDVQGKADPEPGPTPEHGSKMQKIVEVLRQVRAEEANAKIIMFCQWERILKYIGGTLEKLGEPAPLILKGTTLQRQATIRDFVHSPAKEHSVLLLSLEKSPTGMNLVCCHHLFLIHPMFAHSKERAIAFEMQAIGRLRRQGQQKNVIVHRFVTEGTIEEDITTRHQTHLEEVVEALQKKESPEDPERDGKRAKLGEGLQAGSPAAKAAAPEDEGTAAVEEQPAETDEKMGNEEEEEEKEEEEEEEGQLAAGPAAAGAMARKKGISEVHLAIQAGL